MRLFLNQNKLPAACDTTGLELANVHWHPSIDHWTRDLPTSRRFIIEAFSNGVDARKFKGPCFFDIEAPALTGDWRTKEFRRWLNIHTDAIQRTREVLPGRELFSMDAVIGNSQPEARENIAAAEQMLRLLDGVSVSMYPKADGTFTPANEPTLDEYLHLRDATFTGNRRLQVGIAVNNWAGGIHASLDTFRKSIQYGAKRGVDFIIFWQAEDYYTGGVAVAAGLQRYIDVMKEVAR